MWTAGMKYKGLCYVQLNIFHLFSHVCLWVVSLVRSTSIHTTVSYSALCYCTRLHFTLHHTVLNAILPSLDRSSYLYLALYSINNPFLCVLFFLIFLRGSAAVTQKISDNKVCRHPINSTTVPPPRHTPALQKYHCAHLRATVLHTGVRDTKLLRQRQQRQSKAH